MIGDDIESKPLEVLFWSIALPNFWAISKQEPQRLWLLFCSAKGQVMEVEAFLTYQYEHDIS